MYLELGCVPIRFIIQSRRLNFLKQILDRDEKSLLKNVLLEQVKKPIKGDWVSTVRKDLTKLNINLSFDQIKSMSKLTFKKIVKHKSE